MLSVSKRFAPQLAKEVEQASSALFTPASETCWELDKADRNKVEAEQLAELRRLGDVLEAGSSSLNQRATTLAGLAVAGIGTFGLFAGRLNEVDGADARTIVAAALIAASLSLGLGALFALLSVLPGDKWGKEFAKEAQPLIEGRLDSRGSSSAGMVKMQFRRNSEKATWMRRAYWATAFALVTVVGAVLVVATSFV